MLFASLPQPKPICGLYYIHTYQNSKQGLFSNVVNDRVFLPQVQLEAHATILQATSRVTLSQTFVNPAAAKAIREVKYVFPLYEGVSVVDFTCHVANRTIIGEVKEKGEAKQDYTAAVERGETAGLMEQLDTSDTFMTTIGNIPPGARVVIELTYLGELKHDMEVDGIRFTIPAVIAPRYGNLALGADTALEQFQRYTSSRGGHSGNISVVVDAEMAEGSFIQKILSPSHPISVSMGTTSSAPNVEPKMSKASTTLSVESTHLDKDFILQIVAKDTGVPKAILESHSTIPNQRALMATLVPKFALPPNNPEIVFVCDRSGSMQGTKMALVRQALQIFLKSLPVGAMFNICSFGSTYSFLWPRSVAYNQQTLNEAVVHMHTLEANYGGTEMLQPLKATMQQRYRDIPLEIILLTDGAIWDQNTLFNYLNEQVQDKKAPVRVFSLGIGSEVSHALVEGAARAGNGFSQTVGEGEKMSSKVVRMLKGALSPHVYDYTLEVKYNGSKETLNEEDDFEIVERVAESLTVKLSLDKDASMPREKKPISLFDPSVDSDNREHATPNTTKTTRYAHLPDISAPKIIQAPQSIPSLFAFNRTTIYLLLGPDAPRQTPQSVVLRGTSAHGPLELEIPVQSLDKPGTMIHQLAAKKATYELEEGRGWLSQARDEAGHLLKETYESRFNTMVEREAVRLGLQFQVSGKWCSFVAIEKGNDNKTKKPEEQWEYLEDEPAPQIEPFRPNLTKPSLFGSANQQSTQAASGGLFAGLGPQPTWGWGSSNTAAAFGAFGQTAHTPSPGGGLFGQNKSPVTTPFDASTGASSGLFGTAGSAPKNGGGFGGFGQSSNAAPQTASLFGSVSRPSDNGQGGGLFGQQNTGGSLFGAVSSPHTGQGGGLFGLPQGGNAARAADQTHAFQHYQQQVKMAQQHAMQQQQGFGQQQQQQQQLQSSALFGQSTPSATPSQRNQTLQDYQMDLMLLEQQNKKRLMMERQQNTATQANPSSALFGKAPSQSSAAEAGPSGTPNAAPQTDDETLAVLASLQTFEGAWEYSPSLFLALKTSETTVEDARAAFNGHLPSEATSKGQGDRFECGEMQWATALAVAYFEQKLASLQGSWELIVDKARDFLAKEVGEDRKEGVLGSAEKFFREK